MLSRTLLVRLARFVTSAATRLTRAPPPKESFPSEPDASSFPSGGLRATWEARGYTAWERYDHNRIDLVPDRQTYRPGETARLMIQSPWEQATALMSRFLNPISLRFALWARASRVGSASGQWRLGNLSDPATRLAVYRNNVVVSLLGVGVLGLWQAWVTAAEATNLSELPLKVAALVPNLLICVALYTLDEGIYIAPRAPTNTWNLWHEAHIDPLFARLIENLEFAADLPLKPGQNTVTVVAREDQEFQSRRSLVIYRKPPAEVAGGRVPGAVHIPMNDIPAHVDEMPKDAPVFVICQSGSRSRAVVDHLRSRVRDGWWVAVVIYVLLLVGQRLWRARRWVPPEWPEADYGWKVTHLHWVPFHVLDVVFGVPLVFAVVIALLAI